MTINNLAAPKVASSDNSAWRWDNIRSVLGRLITARFPGKIRSRADHVLQVEEKLSLGTKKILYLVSCREKEFLVAASADTIVSVLEIFAEKPAQTVGRKKAVVSRSQNRERLQ